MMSKHFSYTDWVHHPIDIQPNHGCLAFRFQVEPCRKTLPGGVECRAFQVYLENTEIPTIFLRQLWLVFGEYQVDGGNSRQQRLVISGRVQDDFRWLSGDVYKHEGGEWGHCAYACYEKVVWGNFLVVGIQWINLTSQFLICCFFSKFPCSTGEKVRTPVATICLSSSWKMVIQSPWVIQPVGKKTHRCVYSRKKIPETFGELRASMVKGFKRDMGGFLK